jgi:hypothetical protein
LFLGRPPYLFVSTTIVGLAIDEPLHHKHKKYYQSSMSTDTATSQSPTSPSTSNYTKVYFHHINGGSILKTRLLNPVNGPVLSTKDASPFKIIPLNDQNKPMPSSCWSNSSLANKSKYIELLQTEEWSNVVIQNEDGQYLSCRRKTPAMNSALAEYKNEIGEFEKLKMEYNPSSMSFAFKSHNDLYLHYNHYAGIIAFKDREKSWAGWIVNPFTLDDDPLNDKMIRFVGVANVEDGEFLMQKNCKAGFKPAWKSEVMLKSLLGSMSEKMTSLMSSSSNTMGSGTCTIVESEDGENTWFITKTKEGILNIVIASVDCPSYIGALCVEEIEVIFDKTEETEKEAALEKLMFEIDNQYQFATTGNLKDKIKGYHDKMIINLHKLQENKEHAQDLVSRCEEMKILGRKCYGRLSQLPGDKWTRGAKKAPDAIVKGVANLAGTFAGSRLGNKMFGQKADIVIDATSNLEVGQNGPIYKFWTRRFVSFGSKMGEAEVDLSSAIGEASLNEGNTANTIFVPSSMPSYMPPPPPPFAPTIAPLQPSPSAPIEPVDE